MTNIVILTINPKNISKLFHSKDQIKEVVVISVDYNPMIFKSSQSYQKSQLYSFDVVGIIVQYKPFDVITIKEDLVSKYIIAENFVLTQNKHGILLSLNGHFNIIPDRLLAQIYKEFESSKNLSVGNIDELLEINSNQPAIRAYNRLSNYFSPEKYSINKNIFKLIEHSSEAINVSKRVILQAIVVYEEARR